MTKKTLRVCRSAGSLAVSRILLLAITLGACASSATPETAAAPADATSGGAARSEGEMVHESYAPDVGLEEGRESDDGMLVDDTHAELESAASELGAAISLAGEPDCARAGELRDRICDLAERICAIAARNPHLVSAPSRCRDGSAQCDRARAEVGDRCGE